MVRFMKLFFIPVLLFVLSAAPVFAEEVTSGFALKEKAVAYAAQVDAYGLYCEKEATLADHFLTRFREGKVLTVAQDKRLVAVRDKNKNDTSLKLKADAKECDDLEFMLKKLEIMRGLKDVSYLLNGVAQEDIPKDNIPALEALLPPKTQP